MKHDQHMADEQERQMLEHFRQHSSGEPSAQLDADSRGCQHLPAPLQRGAAKLGWGAVAVGYSVPAVGNAGQWRWRGRLPGDWREPDLAHL